MIAKKKPAQSQKTQPGKEHLMHPEPQFDDVNYLGANKLKNKVAIITGGDSGIGRAVAIAFAKEGAHVVITYLNEHADAKKTKELVEAKNQECLILAGDITDASFCKKVVKETIKTFKNLHILVNNAAIQHPQDDFLDIKPKELLATFNTNILAYFFMIKEALPHLNPGSTIINTTSVTAYKGSDHLIDYSATKGAIVSLTRSLSQNLVDKHIRVNGVAPGPVWTPLIPATFTKKEVAQFGQQVPMKRPAEPMEIAPSYIFLASTDSSYMTGQILHPNGGVIVNG